MSVNITGITLLNNDNDGVPTVKAVLVPEPLKDVLGGVALRPGDALIIIQDAVYDAGEELVLSLSKGWDGAAGLTPVTRRN